MSEPDANSARDFSAAYRQQWHHFTQFVRAPRAGERVALACAKT
jgi:hypothetical protein